MALNISLFVFSQAVAHLVSAINEAGMWSFTSVSISS